MNTELTVTGNEIRTMIQQANLSDSTKVKYISAIERYLSTGTSLADSAALTAYAQSLSQSGRAFLKSAVRLWTEYIGNQAYGQATPENIAAVQATEYRLRALDNAIKVKANKGTKAHIWLSQAEVRQLLSTCDDSTITGQRDKLVLGLLAGAGLRREELAALTWGDIKTQPIKGKVRTILSIRGKGDKSRVIPINNRLANALDRWAGIVGREGLVIRSLGMNREPGESISAVAIFHIVAKAGSAIGKPELAPHDLRRTYAQIGYQSGVSVAEISGLLGHASMTTTQRYLDLKTNLETTASDFVPFE